MRWLLPLALVCACHKASPAPTCDQVAAHMHDIILAGLTAQHAGLAPPTVEVMAQQCRTSAYSDAVRRCLAAATQSSQIPACRKLDAAPGGSAH